MRTSIFPGMMLLVVAVIADFGCQSPPSDPPQSPAKPLTPPSTQAQTLVGTLRGGMMAIGGETSGWILAGDGATGRIELDVSRVEEKARALEGRRVSITGMMKDKKYVERGTVRVLVADEIREAPLAPAP